MKPKLIPGLALVLSCFLVGCETEYITDVHNCTVSNLHGDGQTETNVPVTGNCGGGLFDGKTRLAFYLGDSPSCVVVLYFPTNTLNQMLRVPIDSQQAYGWLVRTQLDCKTLWTVKTPAAMPFPNTEPLHGKIEIAQYDWRHNNRFHFAWDLAGADGVAIKGEMNNHTKDKFDAKQLWLDPYLIIFGPFVKW
jgi:hypothetical protein